MLIAVSVQYRASLGISLVHLAQIACKKYRNIQAGPRCSGFLCRVKSQKRVDLHCTAAEA